MVLAPGSSPGHGFVMRVRGEYKSTVHQVASVAPWRLNYGAANKRIRYYVKRDDYRDGAG